MQSTAAYVLGVNRTYRKTLPGGATAVVPRVVAGAARPGDRILDYGAGTAAVHARELAARGLDVTAYDIGGNFDPAVHDPRALSRTYDLVYASNVINVQPDAFRLELLLDAVAAVLRPGGRFVANYPEPRKGDLAIAVVEAALRRRFGSAERVPNAGSPVWICTKDVFAPPVQAAARRARRR
jgi:SAM-dependent methyltransferase